MPQARIHESTQDAIAEAQARIAAIEGRKPSKVEVLHRAMLALKLALEKHDEPRAA